MKITLFKDLLLVVLKKSELGQCFYGEKEIALKG